MLLHALTLALGVLAVAGAPPDDEPEQRRVVHLRVPDEDSTLPGSSVVGDLRDGEVVELTVQNATGHATGHVRQCVRTQERLAPCWNPFPVQFDSDGAARVQYQLDARECPTEVGCVIAVDVDGTRTVAHTIFGAPAPPPPHVELSPPGPYVEGDLVTVVVSNVAPLLAVGISYCDPRCADRTSVAADDLGHATTTVQVGGRCPCCGIAVLAGVTETFVTLRFAPTPTPHYHPTRLAGGLAAAAVLLILAWLIIVTTDWRPPSEAATPDLDAADL